MIVYTLGDIIQYSVLGLFIIVGIILFIYLGITDLIAYIKFKHKAKKGKNDN